MKGRGQAAAFLLAFAIAWPLSSCGRLAAGDRTVLLVSAAASLKESAEQAAREYMKQHPDVKIEFNFGSSGTLQRQIEQGAPADLFLSAGQAQMDALNAKHLVQDSRDVLSNRLVLIVRSDLRKFDSIKDISGLLAAQFRTIGIGEPETVPAGIYAKQTLTSLGVWDKLQTKLVYGKDVRQVLTYVETGNADAGIVYRTDAEGDSKVTSLLEFDAESHEPILYPFGLLANSGHPREAEAFYRYLASEPALKVFQAYGFSQP